MAELVIRCPGQPEQVLEIGDEPITIGRAEDCRAFIAEKKASRRHLTVRRNRDGLVIAEDQDSSNGTFLVGAGGGQRILRRVLEEGDELRIGDTSILLRAGARAPDAAPLVSGTLQLVPSRGALPAVEEPAPALPSTPGPGPARDEPRLEPRSEARLEERGETPGQRRALVRGLVLCGVAVLLFAGVELYLGAKAAQKSVRKDAHLEALRVLEDVGKGAEHFQKRRDAFAVEYPSAPELLTLDRYLERIREREAYVRQKRDALNTLQGQLQLAERSDVRMRLLQLMRELPDEEDYVRDVQRMLAGLDRRKAEEDLEDLRALDRRVQELRERKAYAEASRLVRSFQETHEGMGAEAHDRWKELRAVVLADLQATSAGLWKALGEEQEPSRQRALLAQAWPVLAGTPDGERVAEKLRSAAALAAPRIPTPGSPGRPAEPGTPGAGATPRVPTVVERLLARAKEAEDLLARRAWAQGREVLAALATETEGGRLQAEWQERLGEVDLVLGLVRALAESAQEERKPRRKLSSGTWNVVGASATDVTLESGKGSVVHAWSDLPEKDVLVLLTPARLQEEQRRAVAILAANLGDREAFVQVLLPVFEKGGDLTLANALVARHLYGRASAPEGGYQAYQGELLDRTGYERRKTEERITFLRTDAERVLAQIGKDPGFKKLAKLKELRAELDKRRAYALQAIFNTTHYPYPYDRGSQAYRVVQDEIDRRTALVKEVWDNSLQVRIKRAGPLAKQLEAWDLILVELQAKGVDVTELQAKIAPFALYVTDEAIGIREFYESAAERDLLAYNRWVTTLYNPARSEYARESERKQVEVTNEYRMMIGFTAAVTPGAAPYESITKDNVVQILDQARVDKLSPLRAVRIDNRLVASARLHSEDMSMRGYFAHQAPPNPATGRGSTGPADRMMAQGYQGYAYSENIATSASPTQAHAMWLHSSGHHRNILTGWIDMGSGVGGRNFTQNFASGGGARAEIQPDTAIREGQGTGRAGTGSRRGQ